MTRYQRRYSISPTCQLHNLLKYFPRSNGRIHSSQLRWETNTSPTPLSDDYRLEVYYRQGRNPKVYVSGGSFTSAEAVRKAPHQFSSDPELLKVHVCLSKYDWNETMLIAKTLVPWAMEWLFYYEVWLATGAWLGDEAPHS